MTSPVNQVLCRTPTPDKQPKRIEAAKFALVRRAILAVVPHQRKGVLFRDLSRLVAARLSPQERRGLGSVPWYVTTVKLELEVRGEIRRLSGVTPQRLVRL
jgi:hypothetical protein